MFSCFACQSENALLSDACLSPLLECTSQSTLTVSSCDSSEERPPSLYEQYCCVKSNIGETIILTGEHKHTYIVCPLELLSTCQQLSCSDVLKSDPTAPSGYYNITLSNGTTTLCIVIWT